MTIKTEVDSYEVNNLLRRWCIVYKSSSESTIARYTKKIKVKVGIRILECELILPKLVTRVGGVNIWVCPV